MLMLLLAVQDCTFRKLDYSEDDLEALETVPSREVIVTTAAALAATVCLIGDASNLGP
jgi:hypothetical protein